MLSFLPAKEGLQPGVPGHFPTAQPSPPPASAPAPTQFPPPPPRARPQQAEQAQRQAHALHEAQPVPLAHPADAEREGQWGERRASRPLLQGPAGGGSQEVPRQRRPGRARQLQGARQRQIRQRLYDQDACRDQGLVQRIAVVLSGGHT